MRRTENWLARDGTVRVPFPLRAGYVAYVEVPQDMTTQEAARLSAMVKSLAVPTEEGKP